jgi:trans-2,3-dihydro-3-hydroxyanthranilate isomerase
LRAVRSLAFRLLDVFAIEGKPFTGNPLCVFEDGRDLSDAEMLSLARQFHLSETTFVLPAGNAGEAARVRIFTPNFELPFAGHPTLGTAQVVRSSRGGDELVLGTGAGPVEVKATGSIWTLQAPQPPQTRAPEASRSELAAMLGLETDAVDDDPLWVSTGNEQLIVPLTRAEHVMRARPDMALLRRHGFSAARGESMAYIWARAADGAIVARYLYSERGGIGEDPATGSACANLGAWHIATGKPLPLALRVRQGDAVQRPSLLHLHVDAQKRIFVGGAVNEVGRGTFTLP